jgi:biofilm protein TabA
MIYDTLEHAGDYMGLHTGLARGLAFLAESAAKPLEDGKHAIDGDRIYAMVSSYATKRREDGKFEAHRKYIDIQFLVTGRETALWAPLAGLSPEVEYSEQNDAVLFASGDGVPLLLGDARFAVFFPQDAHMPCCLIDRPETVRKIVVKVRIR